MFSGQDEYQTSAKALTVTHVGFMDKDRFLQLFEEHPSLRVQLFARFTREINALEDRIVEVSYDSVQDRLIHLILSAEERYSRDEKNGWLVVDLSRQDWLTCPLELVHGQV
ncbi:MAG: hypothetical protein A2Z21_03355 [Candidatus Fraserbacteria bacterium RBG_16_55_9]|uniref:Cyclic nucleotide-binding domain-containing protein n=1 Tax=Fraserbacteria sp. (strain RBG_16_55_9) TaxID=1817864 RepID=A0A1F5UPK8_FRAXR|nr:MAG: hypothetical protein A2Z21_03355 [Candidatus Fraserbacteria bacterium RBG_16_55_9]